MDILDLLPTDSNETWATTKEEGQLEAMDFSEESQLVLKDCLSFASGLNLKSQIHFWLEQNLVKKLS